MSSNGAEPPSADELAGVFRVAAVDRTDGTVRYFGEPLGRPAAVVEELRPQFAQSGYSLSIEHQPSGSPETRPAGGDSGAQPRVDDPGGQSPGAGPGLRHPADGSVGPGGQQYALVAEPRADGGVPWLNVALLVVTIASTLFVGASSWYYIPVTEDPLRLFEAWPFAVAMLGVLGIHELGHYAAAKYHGVDVTLPYFIPFPSLLGTMGAVINIRGRIPSRRALFDIGVAGPLAGLVATVFVTVVGFTLDPITVPERVRNGGAEYTIEFQDPLLMQTLEAFVDALGIGVEYGAGEAVHPVVFAGWAGMFFTFLNLLPVGQLDGGHIVRAIVGQRQETVAAAVPGALFTLAGVLYVTRDPPPVGFGVWSIWIFWGLLALGLAYAGPARPTVDEPLDRRRTVLGVVTFLLGIACFTPIPFEIVAA